MFIRLRQILTAVLLLMCSIVVVADETVAVVSKAAQTLDENFLFQPLGKAFGDWKPQGLKFHDVNFESADGTKLHGWFCPCQKSVATILYLRGNAANLTYRATITVPSTALACERADI